MCGCHYISNGQFCCKHFSLLFFCSIHPWCSPFSLLYYHSSILQVSVHKSSPSELSNPSSTLMPDWHSKMLEKTFSTTWRINSVSLSWHIELFVIVCFYVSRLSLNSLPHSSHRIWLLKVIHTSVLSYMVSLYLKWNLAPSLPK